MNNMKKILLLSIISIINLLHAFEPYYPLKGHLVAQSDQPAPEVTSLTELIATKLSLQTLSTIPKVTTLPLDLQTMLALKRRRILEEKIARKKIAHQPKSRIVHSTICAFTSEIPSSYAQEVLVSGLSDGTIHVWDEEHYNKPVGVYHANAHSKKVTCLCPYTNNLLISGSNDTTIKVWEPSKAFTTQHNVFCWALPKIIFDDHRDPIQTIRHVGATIISSSYKKLKFFDPEKPDCWITRQNKTHIFDSAIINDNQLLTIEHNSIQRWDLNSEHPFPIISAYEYPVEMGSLKHVCVLKNLIFVGCSRGLTAFDQRKTDKPYATFNSNAIEAMAACNNGSFVTATANNGSDARLELWDINNITEGTTPNNPVVTIRISEATKPLCYMPTKKFVATAQQDVSRIRTFSPQEKLGGHIQCDFMIPPLDQCTLDQLIELDI